MRIVHIITRLIVGGAQENTLLSCEGQHAAGHDVTLITGPSVGPEGSLVERANAAGYEVVVEPTLVRALRPVTDWRAVGRLRSLIRERKPDVVHTHSSKAGILGRYAAHKENVPAIVHTIHGLAFTASTSKFVNTGYVHAERRAARWCHKIVCVADAMAKQSLARNIGQPDQYVTVHSGMDVEPFLDPPVPRADVRQQLGLADDHVAVGTIARLFDLKGHEDLIAHAPRLCEQFPNLRFVWIGDGSLRGSFERQIAGAELTDRFIFTGLVPPSEIPQLVNALDIVAHPSRREGLARALPQGALAGCPVVTYDIDGNAEALIEGETGWAVAPFDTSVFADRIVELAGDAPLRRRMGEAGRAFCRETFSTQAMVDGLEDVYRSLVPTPLPGSAMVS
ncbi:MAG: glycosyltransferase family 4 protein [Planctomycetota bacterium]